MEITVYNTSSDRRRLNKDLQQVGVIPNVKIKDKTSIIDPVFVVSKSLLEGLRYNYCYVADLNRYYFINNIEYDIGGLILLHCHVDVLETYKDYILTHNAYIVRQEKNFGGGNNKNGAFFDSQYPIRSDVIVEPIDIGVVGNSYAYYLTVNGGVQ